MTSEREPVLEVEGLTVDVWDRDGWVNVVDGVSFRIDAGESLGLVGESGCGKSTIAYALLGYRRPGSRIREGVVRLEGQDLLRLPEHALRAIRGNRVCLVPQNPAGSLTPSMRIGPQVVEVLEAHGRSSGRYAERSTIELLAQAGLPEPAAIARRYPHEISGGQQQRVVIAMALACRPTLLVLDEPTTALDVTTQARILRLLARLRREQGMSMLYVTHNLGVVAQICDRVAVMYAGDLVEVAPTEDLFGRPLHPYTQGLLAAVPRIDVADGGGPRLRGLLRRKELPEGCRFAPRCPHAVAECFVQRQSLTAASEDHRVGCWLWPTINASAARARGRSLLPP